MACNFSPSAEPSIYYSLCNMSYRRRNRRNPDLSFLQTFCAPRLRDGGAGTAAGSARTDSPEMRGRAWPVRLRQSGPLAST
jgi:hypothetical protein